MSGDLFENLPEQAKPQGDSAAPLGAARLREPRRDQVELRPVDLDSLLAEDHPARVIWTYVEGLDLSELEARIKSREGRPGHPAIAPRLSLALWLYATSNGIGSARSLAHLCESHEAYRWLCGGVSVNYHTLSEFRSGCADLIDRLLAQHLAALAKVGLVDLDTLTQDGVRIRANAGAASFRREATLDRLVATAQVVVEDLKRELDSDPEASTKRIKAAKERAARERLDRVKAAQAALAEIKQQRKAREEERGNGKKPKEPKEPRASTTDPDARVMKMADGGFRPAYNVQVATVAGEQIVVGVEVTNIGSDRGLMRPKLEHLRARLGHYPKRHLADGGFTSADDIEWAHDRGIEVYCPPTQSKHGTDPFEPKRGDGPGVLAWRARMKSEAGQERYKQRPECECIHARWRNWHLYQFAVRGFQKVCAQVLLHALANNILQGHRMRIQAAS
jgi:transposase